MKYDVSHEVLRLVRQGMAPWWLVAVNLIKALLADLIALILETDWFHLFWLNANDIKHY